MKNAMFYMSLIMVLVFGALAIYVSPITDGWNDYWFDRFDDGQCEEICKDNKMVLVTQDPSECGCKNFDTDLQLNFRRPQSFRDSLAFWFA